MKIAVNDANIFIDLMDVDLLKEFFGLGLTFHTTALVVAEIDGDEYQRKQLQPYIRSGALKVKSLDEKEMIEVNRKAEKTGKLTIQDISVYFFAAQINAMILTGDKSLRKEAKKLGFEVHGILWVFDQLLENNLIDLSMSIERLKKLMQLNSWLPFEDCYARIIKWEKLLQAQPKTKIKKKRK